MTNLIVFCFGLVIGSFLNAVIYRLSVNESAMNGRSYCPHCKHKLVAKDLIPVVSFFALNGKCRYCSKPISWQYPSVELATAILFVLVYMRLASDMVLGTAFALRFIFICASIAVLIVIFVYDLKYYLISDMTIIVGTIIAFVGNLIAGISIVNMLGAAAVSGGFFALLFIVTRGRGIGGGDIYLGFFMGILLGWPLILIALFIAYAIGALVGVPLLLTRALSWNSKVPFGPFLTAATIITLLAGQPIMNWYLGLLM